MASTAPASRASPSSATPSMARRRRNAVNGVLDDTVELVRRQCDELLKPRHRLLITATMRRQELQLEHQLSRRRALNRWALALFLLNNPSLRKYRRPGVKPLIVTDTVEEEPLEPVRSPEMDLIGDAGPSTPSSGATSAPRVIYKGAPK